MKTYPKVQDGYLKKAVYVADLLFTLLGPILCIIFFVSFVILPFWDSMNEPCKVVVALIAVAFNFYITGSTIAVLLRDIEYKNTL